MISERSDFGRRLLAVARRSDELTKDEATRSFGFDHMTEGCSAVHASCFRSYQLLELVKEWLSEGVPPRVVLELVAHIEELAAEHEAKGKR